MAETKVINICDLPGGVIPASDDYVYIGRKGRGQSGYFGNPVVVGKSCPECGETHDRGETLSCYEVYLKRRLRDDPIFRERVRKLRGKTLVCFCPPAPCHGDVLSRVAEELAGAEQLSPSESLGDNKEEKMKEKTEEFVALLAGAFIRGKTLNDRPATKRAMDVIKAHFLTNTSLGEEAWSLIKQRAVELFTAHEEEEGVVVLYDEDNNSLDTDEELLDDARRRAERWYKTINRSGGCLDPLFQGYINTLEELLFLQHKLEVETRGYAPGELDRLIEQIDELEFELVHRELLVVEQSTRAAKDERDRRHKERLAKARLCDLRSYVEGMVLFELEQDSMEYLFEDGRCDGLDAYEPELVAETAIEALDHDEELKLLVEEAKSGRHVPKYEPNWAHIWAIKQRAEQAMQEFLARLEREQGIALHGQEEVEGKMRPFIFPETEHLLTRYRAKLKSLAESTDNEQEYETNRAEMRKIMMKIFQRSQQVGQERYRAQLVVKLKEELNHLRKLFLMPPNRAELKRAQKEHLRRKKPARFFPLLCKNDLLCNSVVRKLDPKLLGIEDNRQLNLPAPKTRDGWVIKHKGADPLAALSRERLMDLHNDVVEALLALGVKEEELPNFNGSPFLLPYEEHMTALGRADEAERAVKAREERDEKLEAMKFQQGLERAIDLPSYVDEDGNLIQMEIPDTNGISPEEHLLALESHYGD